MGRGEKRVGQATAAMGDYTALGGYSAASDAGTSFDDLKLLRFQVGVKNPGTPEETRKIIYVYENQGGSSEPRSEGRRHRTVRLHNLEKRLRFVMRVQDRADHDVVIHDATFVAKVAAERAVFHAGRVRSAMAEPPLSRKVKILQSLMKQQLGAPQQPRDPGDLLDDDDVRTLILKDGDVDAARDRIHGDIQFLVLVQRMANSPSFKQYVNKLIRWLSLHENSYIPLVELSEPVGYAGDEEYPSTVMIKHVETQVRGEGRDGLGATCLEAIRNFAGWHRIRIRVPFSPFARSVHYQVVAPAGLALRSAEGDLVRALPKDRVVDNRRMLHIHVPSDRIEELNREYSTKVSANHASNAFHVLDLKYRETVSTSLLLWWVLLAVAFVVGLGWISAEYQRGVAGALASLAIAYSVSVLDKPVLRRLLPFRLLAALPLLFSREIGGWILGAGALVFASFIHDV